MSLPQVGLVPRLAVPYLVGPRVIPSTKYGTLKTKLTFSVSDTDVLCTACGRVKDMLRAYLSWGWLPRLVVPCLVGPRVIPSTKHGSRHGLCRFLPCWYISKSLTVAVRMSDSRARQVYPKLHAADQDKAVKYFCLHLDHPRHNWQHAMKPTYKASGVASHAFFWAYSLTMFVTVNLNGLSDAKGI